MAEVMSQSTGNFKKIYTILWTNQSFDFSLWMNSQKPLAKDSNFVNFGETYI
jgi:hypothetical protein